MRQRPRYPLCRGRRRQARHLHPRPRLHRQRRPIRPPHARQPDGYRLIAVDNLGWGRSSRPTSGYSMEGWVANLVEFMRVLDIDRASLVGHTLGSWISALVAQLFPGRVDRLVLGTLAGLNATAPSPARQFTVPDKAAIKAQLESAFRGSVAVTGPWSTKSRPAMRVPTSARPTPPSSLP
ncbi:MAG: alpha/beta hydrolase [SAR202 cluster bacterium]|nr:alpha/beta hydrolase [SAR202 cluster bacterium]